MKSNNILLRHPVLFAFIVAIIPLYAASLLGMLTAKLLNNLLDLGLNAQTGGELGEFIGSIFRILVVFPVIGIMKKACGRAFRIGLDAENLKKCLILGVPILFMAVSNFPEYYLKGGAVKSGAAFAAALVTGFAPGLYEEVVMRGTALSNMMLQWKERPGAIYRSLILSASVFGVLHLMNLTNAGTAETLMQVGYAAGVGFLFGAVYLRTKNLTGLVIYHAAVDITAAIFELPPDAPEVIPFTIATTIIITVGGILIGLYLVRKEKHSEILELFYGTEDAASAGQS